MKEVISNINSNFVSVCYEKIIDDLDSGLIRVSSKIESKWVTDQNIKTAIQTFLKNTKSELFDFSQAIKYFDKVHLKFAKWDIEKFQKAKIRVVPGAIVRYSAYLSPGVVVMPSFINVGAYIGENTMIDANATIGSCAQIGSNCHISDGVTIGGVLEPINANPVIIEDGCFVGARSVISESVIVKQNSIISAGVTLTGSTKIIDRETGEITYGKVRENSLVIPGTYSVKNGLSISCAIVMDKRTKIDHINDDLR